VTIGEALFDIIISTEKKGTLGQKTLFEVEKKKFYFFCSSRRKIRDTFHGGETDPLLIQDT